MKQQISNISPEIIKKGYRLIKYKNERRKFVREIGIRMKQDNNLQRNYKPDGSKLVVFIIPGSDWATGNDKISGGTMSIVSICEETAAIQDVHGAQTIMCTMNGDHLLLKHTMFSNNTSVYRFDQLADYFANASEILIHLPEFLAEHFIASLSLTDKKWLQQMQEFHINIMNQNIRLMPDTLVIEDLKNEADMVTITTAHQKYCSQYYRDYFKVPLHKFSVWISPEQYQFMSFKEKQNLLVVSPDPHPMKEIILEQLRGINGLDIKIIQNLTYDEYKALVSHAKWSLTFGEGLDGYLIEPVFSGAIGFAVYNDQFFTPDFKGSPTIYNSYEELKKKLVVDIKSLDYEPIYTSCQQQQFQLCAQYYNKEQYRKNIAAFYKHGYTFS